MADKIKKFFAKKKVDAKFKLAGPGHKMTASSSSQQSPQQKKQDKYAPQQAVQTEAKRQAAEAALLRLSSQKKDSGFNSLSAIQAQVRRELEAEKKAQSSTTSERPKVTETQLESSPHLAVNGIFYRCPMISDAILTKEEWRLQVREFLYEQLEEERGLTACLIIHTCNYNRNKVKECVDVLVRYVDNILGNPTEPKFHKIRWANATFNDKVAPIDGASEFLFAAGFKQEELEHNGIIEQFYIFDESNIDGLETLLFLRDALKAEDRIELELDRNLKVLSPSQAAKRVDLPMEFYSISKEELKREQQTRAEEMEKLTQLRTKAMRERDELREIRKYKFALIRIRFPDGIYLQGTFSVYEKVSEVNQFVQDNLTTDSIPFVLTTPSGHRLTDTDVDKSLLDLRLVPATILMFQWEPIIAEQAGQLTKDTYLKEMVMMLMEAL